MSGALDEQIAIPEGTVVLEKYQVESLIGSGELGRVFKAVHTSVGSRVPDFVKLADAYGCAGFRCERPEDVDATIKAAMDEVKAMLAEMEQKHPTLRQTMLAAMGNVNLSHLYDRDAVTSGTASEDETIVPVRLVR